MGQTTEFAAGSWQIRQAARVKQLVPTLHNRRTIEQLLLSEQASPAAIILSVVLSPTVITNGSSERNI